MDFIEPIEALAPESPRAANDTDKAVHQLEDEIAKGYSAVESQVSGLWLAALKNAAALQQKYKLEEHRQQLVERLSSATTTLGERTRLNESLQLIELQLKGLDLKQLQTQASHALDTLDSKLELVERQAGKYASLFASFFSDIISVNPVLTQTDDDETETIFTSPLANTRYGASRYDTELLKLHTTAAYYLEGGEELDVEARTDEIALLLAQYPDTLERLMNSLVPVKVSYNQFWLRYFAAEAQLKKAEEKRKELLKKETKEEAENDDEGEFTWDDDDDDEVKT